MARKKGSCPYAYWIRDTIHCRVQAELKLKWDFCKYQYFCQASRRHELAERADRCEIAGKREGYGHGDSE